MLSLLVGREESYLIVFYMRSAHARERRRRRNKKRAKSAREGVCGILSKYLPFSANNLSRDE